MAEAHRSPRRGDVNERPCHGWTKGCNEHRGYAFPSASRAAGAVTSRLKGNTFLEIFPRAAANIAAMSTV